MLGIIKLKYRGFRRFLGQGKRFATYLGVLGTIAILFLHTSAPSPVQNVINRLEYLLYDQRMAVMPKAIKPVENKIVIVDLDERSLQAEGQYPWNRIKVGQLTERLSEYGSLVVGFDITFPEPDRNIRDLLAPIDLASLDPAFARTLAEIEPSIDADQYFANAMINSVDAVLAINFSPQGSVSFNELPQSIVEIESDLASKITLTDMSGFTGNIQILQDAARGNGSMNQEPDADGVVRRVPLVIRYGEKLYTTLALEMFRVYNFLENYELETFSYDEVEVVTAVRLGKGPGSFVIPTDGRGYVNVPYVGTTTKDGNNFFPYISATDVLRGSLSESEKQALVNSLVLVGTSAPGLGDLRAMPLQKLYPGVEVHANMLNALLNAVNMSALTVSAGESSTASAFASFTNTNVRIFPYRPDWIAGGMFVALAVLGIALSVLFPYLGPASMVGFASALLGISVWGNFQLWSVYKLDFPLVLMITLIIVLAAINLIYGFLAESQTRKVIKGMFDQYVPPAHIDSMLSDPDNYSFEGESKELSVLFSDIRGFTSISEVLSASQLKKLLNDFFTPITGIIFDHNGTIDKYVGDMVMAFWGAPLEDPDHRAHSVRSALKMIEKTEELKHEFLAAGLPEVNIGVGINTGMMNVGDMGSTYRRSYTVLGDAVNLGSRLESLTKFYGIRLLIGQETVAGLDGFLLRMIDKVKVKGKDEAITCYEPLCELADSTPELEARVKQYHDALELFYAQHWDAAQTAFQTLVELEPHTLLYQVYLERIETLRGQNLGPQWDGSYTHTSK